MIDMLHVLVAPKEVIDECVREEEAIVRSFGPFASGADTYAAKRLWFANELFLHQPGAAGSCADRDVERAFWGLVSDRDHSHIVRKTTSDVFGHARVIQARGVDAWKAWLKRASLDEWAERSLGDVDESESLWVCVCGDPDEV